MLLSVFFKYSLISFLFSLLIFTVVFCVFVLLPPQRNYIQNPTNLGLPVRGRALPGRTLLQRRVHSHRLVRASRLLWELDHRVLIFIEIWDT